MEIGDFTRSPLPPRARSPLAPVPKKCWLPASAKAITIGMKPSLNSSPLLILAALLLQIVCASCSPGARVLLLVHGGEGRPSQLELDVAKATFNAAGAVQLLATWNGNSVFSDEGYMFEAFDAGALSTTNFDALAVLGSRGESLVAAGGAEIPDAFRNLVASFEATGKPVLLLGTAVRQAAGTGILAGQEVAALPDDFATLRAAGATPRFRDLVFGRYVTSTGGTEASIANAFAALLWLASGRSPDDFVKPGLPAVPFTVDSGNNRFYLSHRGRIRSGEFQLPAADLPAAETSLVFALHGQGGTAAGFRQRIDFDTYAARYGFLTVYVNGVGGDWDIIPGTTEPWDDLGLFETLLDKISSVRPFSPARVYAMGHSLGGFMAYRLGYELPGIAAVAPVAGLLYLPEPPKPNLTASLLHIHALDDDNVPLVSDGQYRNPRSVQETLQYWRGALGLTGEATSFLDEHWAQGLVWRSGEGGTYVASLLHKTGGHTWLPRTSAAISDFFYNVPARVTEARFAGRVPAYVEQGSNVTVAFDLADATDLAAIELSGGTQNILLAPDKRSSSFRLNSPGRYTINGTAVLRDGGRIPFSNAVETVVIRPAIDIAEISASSVENAALGPEHVLDGDPFTRWASSWNDGEWLDVSLAKPQQIRGITVNWEAAYATVWELQVPELDGSWRTLYRAGGSRGGLESASFEPVTTSRIRLVFVERASQWGASILDLFVN